MVTYPSCQCRTNKKRPGSSKSSPPSLHCAPGGRHRHSARTYYSTEFVLAGSIIPLTKGGDAVRFFFGPRGLTRQKYSIFPIQKGEMLSFFFRPCFDSIFPLQKGEMLSFFSRPCLGPCSLKYSIFPSQKGEMLSIFLQPLLGRWAAKKIFIPLSPLSPLRGIDVSPWPHRDLEGCNPLKRARINA